MAGILPAWSRGFQPGGANRTNSHTLWIIGTRSHCHDFFRAAGMPPSTSGRET